jgi:CheY-like chemotaxis protein
LVATDQTDYAAWVASLTRGELLDQVLDVEQRLRNLVRGVLTRAKGLEWESLIPTSLRVQLEETLRHSHRPGADVLDAASLKQLIDLVLARWPHFADLLQDKTKFHARADDFREWRNRLAHGSEPTQADKVEIAVLLRQMGAQIPVDQGAPWRPPLGSGSSVYGSTLLWVDDHPEWSTPERQILGALGIRVVPALSNDEAVSLASQSRFDLVISDIDRGAEESGLLLPHRLRMTGTGAPVLFYVGSVDPDREPPEGAEAITNDAAVLVRDTLMLLSGRD